MLSQGRKKYLSELAEFVANEYCPEGLVQPELIAKAKGIPYNYGGYADDFDGMLEHSNGYFHIYINTDRLEHAYKPRARFTFAHELGHYFIDDHRNALQSGQAPAHSSFTNFASENVVEREADYFAACLLLPKERLRSDCFMRKFNFKLADEIAHKYQTSITSTLLRFITIDLYPLMVVCSQENKVKWHWSTQDFPYYNLKYKKEKVPQDTAAGEYFMDGTKYRDTQTVFSDDWFQVWDKKFDRQFYEHCVYHDVRRTVLSVLWED